MARLDPAVLRSARHFQPHVHGHDRTVDAAAQLDVRAGWHDRVDRADNAGNSCHRTRRLRATSEVFGHGISVGPEQERAPVVRLHDAIVTRREVAARGASRWRMISAALARIAGKCVCNSAIHGNGCAGPSDRLPTLPKGTRISFSGWRIFANCRTGQRSRASPRRGHGCRGRLARAAAGTPLGHGLCAPACVGCSSTSATSGYASLIVTSSIASRFLAVGRRRAGRFAMNSRICRSKIRFPRTGEPQFRAERRFAQNAASTGGPMAHDHRLHLRSVHWMAGPGPRTRARREPGPYHGFDRPRWNGRGPIGDGQETPARCRRPDPPLVLRQRTRRCRAGQSPNRPGARHY